MSDENDLVTRKEMLGFWLQRDMATDGLQLLENSQRKTDDKVDALKSSVERLDDSMLLVKVLVIMPSIVATFVLVRVLWILRGTIFEDAQTLLSLVSQ